MRTSSPLSQIVCLDSEIAAIGTRRRRVLLSLPTLAYAHSFGRSRGQWHIRFWPEIFRHGSTGRTRSHKLRLHVGRQTAGVFQSPQLTAKVVLLQERRYAFRWCLPWCSRWETFYADRRLR